jgi:hypothetical protein
VAKMFLGMKSAAGTFYSLYYQILMKPWFVCDDIYSYAIKFYHSNMVLKKSYAMSR